MKIFKLVYAFIKVFFQLQKESISVRFIEINEHLNKNENDRVVPKKIWMFWDGDNLPHIVKICLESIYKHCGDYEINLLNSVNVKNYIDLPELSQDVLIAQKADLIRLELLAAYGGIWIDASIFLNENFDWIFEKFKKQDAFLFFSDECTVNLEKPITENWFIVAPENSEFICAWRDEFKKCITSSDPKKFYNNILYEKELIQNLTHTEYLLCYISAIVCLHKQPYNILYASSADVGHYYNYKLKWDGYALAISLLIRNKEKISKPYLLKITSEMRRPLNFFLRYNIFNRKSLIMSDHE